LIITYITEQGGVGKTSLCYNLAWYLASQGKKILMVDLDPQKGNLSYFAGIEDKDVRPTIKDVLTKEKKIQDIIYRVTPNLSIIPANSDVTLVPELVNYHLDGDYKCLKAELDKIKKDYDYIFIDINPTPSVLHILSLVSSDEVIIPLQPDMKTLAGTAGVLETIDTVKEGMNKKLQIRALVFNFWVSRTGLSKLLRDTMKELGKDRGIPVAQTKIPRNVAIGETPLEYVGITTYSPKSKGALAYVDLAKELFRI